MRKRQRKPYYKDLDQIEDWFFEQKIISPSGCWEWTGPRRNSSGYGGLRWMVEYGGIKRSRSIGVHRLAAYFRLDYPFDYLFEKYPRKIICHKCDNPGCFNPEHLYVGSYSDNHIDWHIRDGSIALHSRRVFHKKCEKCLKPIIAKFDRQRFCSTKCRVGWHFKYNLQYIARNRKKIRPLLHKSA